MSQPVRHRPAHLFSMVIAVLAFSWLSMQWNHELGHLIAGTLTGA